MAYGGWLREQVQLGPYAVESDANMEAGLNALLGGLTSFAGWSVKKAATKHFASTRAYHAVAQHSGGAELALLWGGTITSTSTGYWQPVNRRDGGSPTLSMDHLLMIAYMPPGKGAFDNAKHPGNTDWITGNGLTLGFKLYLVCTASSTAATLAHVWDGSSYSVFTWHVRGDDVFLFSSLSAQDDLAIDYIDFWGTGVAPVAHSGDTEQEVFFCYLDGAPSWADVPQVDFHNAAGTQLLKGTIAPITNFLSAAYSTLPPHRAAQLEVMNDLVEGAVSGTDGLKGKISDEVLILTTVGTPPKATWNSGTHLHARSGVWVGSDSSNGPMP